MLKKSKISGVKIYSDEWKQNRLARFTSSEASRLFGSSLWRYVREKVGEELTGKSANTEIDTEATRWGGFYEAEALMKFGQYMKLDFLVTQQLICSPDSRFGGTPDSLIVVRESPDETEWEVETVEVKCPPTYANYIGLFECENPQDLKKENAIYYWQCLDQMDLCESLTGYFVAYHPDFKRGNMKVLKIEANKPIETKKGKVYPVYEDLKLLRAQKIIAEQEFDKIRTKLMKIASV
jgi:hypothetical protein